MSAAPSPPASRRRRRVAALVPMVPPELRDGLEALGLDMVLPPTPDQAGARLALRDADLVIADWSGRFRLGAEEVDVAPRVAYIQQPNVGVESIDLAAWAARGVPVANTAGANATSVAEWCVGATIAVLRSMVWADAAVRAGRWPQGDLATRGCNDLSGRRVGLLGFGAIGTACVPRFAALGCPVSYWSRRRRDPAAELGAVYRDLDDLFATSDVLVCVLALTEQTRGLVDARRLADLPAGAVVVNASRGGLVDEAALAAALATGALAGAAVDVFATEPVDAASPLRAGDRVLLSPHAAAATVEGRARIFGMAAANLLRALNGEPLQDVVNGAPPVVRWRD